MCGPCRPRQTTRGVFDLLGCRKDRGAAIAVFPDGQPYFPRRLKVPDKVGGEPIALDIDLHRGIWISGASPTSSTAVLSRLASLIIRCERTPTPAQLSEFVDRELPDGPGNDVQRTSGEDGTYRILGVPGPALIEHVVHGAATIGWASGSTN